MSRSLCLCLCLCLWAFLLGTVNTAHADDESRAAARLFSAGQQAYEKQDYLTAIRAFEQSQQAKAHPNTVLSLAHACRRQAEQDGDLAKTRRAVELFRKFIQEAPRSPYRAAADAQLIQLVAILAQQPATPVSQPAAPPPTTQLMITSVTPGARVTIDGEPAGGEPAPAIRVVTPGEHTVRCVAPGHISAEQRLTAVRERLVVSAVELKPMPGSLRVVANEEGATVSIDGAVTGRAPLERSGLSPGVHEVAVALRGRRLWSQTVLVESGRSITLYANLVWSRQRKIALGTAGGAVALGIAGLVTGLLAVRQDASLTSVPSGDRTNADRQAWDDRLTARDRLANATTSLFAIAGAAIVAAAGLYWFDVPSVTTGAPGEEPRRTAWHGSTLRLEF